MSEQMTYDQASASLPPVKRANLVRALAILATHPDEDQISYRAQSVCVRDIELRLRNPDDREVVSVLMVAQEFGLALSYFHSTVHELREMQTVWTTLGDEFVREVAA
jgi:hypothetical protein